MPRVPRVENFQAVRELYDLDTVASTIAPKAALEANRFLVDQGWEMANGFCQSIERAPRQSDEPLLQPLSRVEALMIGLLRIRQPKALGILVAAQPVKNNIGVYAPLTVGDLLSQITIGRANGREAVTDPETRDRYIAGPHGGGYVGVGVWELPRTY